MYTEWSGREDLNLRLHGPEPCALPDCATPRQVWFRHSTALNERQTTHFLPIPGKANRGEGKVNIAKTVRYNDRGTRRIPSGSHSPYPTEKTMAQHQKLPRYSYLSLTSALILFSSTGTGYAASSNELAIEHSNIQRLQLWVQPGEVLEIFQSQVCDTPHANCTIFIDGGAKLSVSHSTLGAGLTIYHRDSSFDTLDLSRSKVEAKLIQGAPTFAGALVSPVKTNHEAKTLNHAKLDTFEGNLERSQALSVFYTELCLHETGSPCSLKLQPGAAAEFGHAKLGERFMIESSLPLATGLSFRHTKYPYSVEQGTAVTSVIVDDNNLIVELKKKSIKASASPRGVVIEISDVFFEFDKSSLTAEAQRNMTEISAILRSTPTRYLAVEGHADAIGSDQYNVNLSTARAETVRNALVSGGIPSDHISIQGFGERKPAATNETDEGRARNRRVEIVVSKLNSDRTASTKSVTDEATNQLNREARGRLRRSE